MRSKATAESTLASAERAISKYSVPAGVPHAMGVEVTEKADILRVVFNATKTFN